MDHAITLADVQLLATIKSRKILEPLDSSTTLTRLLNFGLAVLKNSGTVGLSRAGERLLFQKECCVALEALIKGALPDLSADAANWLTINGFIVDAGHGNFAATSRGELWLKSIRADDASHLRNA